jgi:hypothetical protein
MIASRSHQQKHLQRSLGRRLGKYTDRGWLGLSGQETRQPLNLLHPDSGPFISESHRSLMISHFYASLCHYLLCDCPYRWNSWIPEVGRMAAGLAKIFFIIFLILSLVRRDP